MFIVLVRLPLQELLRREATWHLLSNASSGVCLFLFEWNFIVKQMGK
jgi:hypothetical protein